LLQRLGASPPEPAAAEPVAERARHQPADPADVVSPDLVERGLGGGQGWRRPAPEEAPGGGAAREDPRQALRAVLAAVVGIVRSRAVLRAIRREDDQGAARPEHAGRLVDEPAVVRDVLDRVLRDDRVERLVAEPEPGHVHDGVGEAGPGMLRPRLADRVRRAANTDGRPAGPGQEGGAEAGPAGRVEGSPGRRAELTQGPRVARELDDVLAVRPARRPALGVARADAHRGFAGPVPASASYRAAVSRAVSAQENRLACSRPRWASSSRSAGSS